MENAIRCDKNTITGLIHFIRYPLCYCRVTFRTANRYIGDGEVYEGMKNYQVQSRTRRCIADPRNAPDYRIYSINRPGARFSKLPVITGPVKLFCFPF